MAEKESTNQNSSRFFLNRECEHFPCHGFDELNCLFCYCPLYTYEDCGGEPVYVRSGERVIKDCSSCRFPHMRESYDEVMRRLKAGR